MSHFSRSIEQKFCTHMSRHEEWPTKRWEQMQNLQSSRSWLPLMDEWNWKASFSDKLLHKSLDYRTGVWKAWIVKESQHIWEMERTLPVRYCFVIWQSFNEKLHGRRFPYTQNSFIVDTVSWQGNTGDRQFFSLRILYNSHLQKYCLIFKQQNIRGIQRVFVQIKIKPFGRKY